ncbi:MAG TPA: MerR family transcriptional regulator [Candidatus Hydrogenedentes bacterium]|nr:MerR family transcriptional regulator [Candidatus Hydrogenedentota bacterium]HRK36223.1 MerR family transcriptional regulator [Candidatus Hydrogenedentota bacterium]
MAQVERRYSIGEVSELLDVPIHVLRQWESRFPQLKPKRDRVKRRYYLHADIEIARRIKQLTRHEKLSSEGARMRLTQELHIEGRPKTRKELLDLVDRIENDVRDLLDLLDRKPTDPQR